MIARRELLIGAAALASMGAAQAPPQPDPALWDPQGFPVSEGFARGPNGMIYYRVYGRPGRTPVIALHGGPAAGHTYMRPYAALARERQVVLYDQSGCGRSEAPGDFDRYTLGNYVIELEALREHLKLPRVALLGHSWGGFLAPAYAHAHPERASALVLAGTAVRWRDFEDAAQAWLRELGPDAVATVARAEATGRTDTPEYGALLERYYALHLCRLNPPPSWFEAEGEKIGRNPVYLHLNGPSEFQFTGVFRDLDSTAALRALKAPVLVTCGEFDEGPPSVARRIAALAPHARLHVFDGLSHMSHIEDPARVTAVTAAFLKGTA